MECVSATESTSCRWLALQTFEVPPDRFSYMFRLIEAMGIRHSAADRQRKRRLQNSALANREVFEIKWMDRKWGSGGTWNRIGEDKQREIPFGMSPSIFSRVHRASPFAVQWFCARMFYIGSFMLTQCSLSRDGKLFDQVNAFRQTSAPSPCVSVRASKSHTPDSFAPCTSSCSHSHWQCLSIDSVVVCMDDVTDEIVSRD